MAISLLSTPAINVLAYSGTFGAAGEYHVVYERQNLTGATRSVAAGITLGGAAMTLLASMEWQGHYVVALWGFHVTPALAGTAFSMVRTAGVYALTDRVDVAVLSGVSTDPIYAKHEIRLGVGSTKAYSHTIAVAMGGMVLDRLGATNDTGSPNSGQSYTFSSSYKASHRAAADTGALTVGWTWTAARACYACVSLRPLQSGGGIMGIV